MSLGDMFDFEKFNLKEMWNKVREDPERLFLGAADPIGGKLWGEILHKDYDPIVNQWGGPTGSTFDKAAANGVDTGWSESSHDAARVIAGLFAGNYAAGAAGFGGGAGGAEAGGGAGSGAGGLSYGGGESSFMGGSAEPSGFLGDMSGGNPYGEGINWSGDFGGGSSLDGGMNYTGSFTGETGGNPSTAPQERSRTPRNNSNNEPDRTGAQALGRQLQERMAAASQQYAGGTPDPFTAQGAGQTAVTPTASPGNQPYQAEGADAPLSKDSLLAMMLEERNKAAAAGKGY